MSRSPFAPNDEALRNLEMEESKPFIDEYALDLPQITDQGEGSYDSIEDGKRSFASSASATESYMLYTPLEEEEVVKKLDRRLVLFVAFLYMLSFLDRSNIGNAKIAGLSRDLHLSSNEFEWLLKGFYIAYISFEWMTILWKILPAHIYLAFSVLSWGLIASSQSLVSSFASIMVLRGLLGIGEAAFVGIPFYLSFFYNRNELAFRTGLFISAAPLATSISGSIAWLITKSGKYIPISPWRTLFLLEGFPSIIAAVFVWIYIPDHPGKAAYLSPRQQKVACLRLGHRQLTSKDGTDSSRWEDARRTLLDPKAYLTAMMFFCCNVAFASLPVFLPSVIQEFGYSAIVSQALTAPPYLLAFCTVVLTAWLSDRAHSRSIFVVFHALLACFGYIMMAVTSALQAHPVVRYLGVFPAATSLFSSITIIITWTLNNQESEFSRGVSLSLLNYIGQLGPLVGVHLFPDSDSYTSGMVWCAFFMGLVAVLAVLNRSMLIRENRSREATGLVSGESKVFEKWRKSEFIVMI